MKEERFTKEVLYNNYGTPFGEKFVPSPNGEYTRLEMEIEIAKHCRTQHDVWDQLRSA